MEKEQEALTNIKSGKTEMVTENGQEFLEDLKTMTNEET